MAVKQGKMQAIYQDMWQQATAAIGRGQYQTDALINNPADTRRGVTVLSYLSSSQSLVHEINGFLQGVLELEPQQYRQPVTDMHLTVLSIISCIAGLRLQDLNIAGYGEVLQRALAETTRFEVMFRGITASPSCILLQGFVADERQLSALRERLRQAYRDSGLPCSIDSRYKIATAHATLVRFNAPLQQPQRLLDYLAQYRDYDFGRHAVTQLSLVFNNWYQQQQHTRLLATVPLR
ncbi:2'-5' RNA ligase family protein [Shewanella dokdonensis]|uniref:Mutarotase n=1 Tax=Shewanella dokdonensis TaxID=712036 RepID=A0ABX8DH96_9GAMM|nr:hypothetical protein [Shewanella dokdonensis]MCL1074377.1 hypothetical protein [Shewanella dokdonensis]QVK24055.1 hypothetical protein KHX94_05445 [Shewanella dokdonensis]